MKALARLIAVFAFICLSIPAMARDWYVSAERGSGKTGTKEKPAADLGSIISQLQPGDVVYIAEGVYTGKGDSGVDIINVPVELYGGWSSDFSVRDPWGKHRTIFTGVNKTKNWVSGARIEFDLSKYRDTTITPIVVDGFIIDQGPQNRYKDASELMIVRTADPKTGSNPTPDRGGIFIRVSQPMASGKNWEIRVKNNVVLNSAPTQGVIAVFSYAESKVEIANNAVINCTGVGIYAGTSWRGSEEKRAPRYDIHNNTVMFIWKYDAYVQSFSGVGFMTDVEVVASLNENIFAFCDRFNVQLNGKWPLLLKNNIFAGAVDSTYYEAVSDMKIDLTDIYDDSEYIHADSDGNIAGPLKVLASKAWLEKYGQRILIDRNAVEADMQAQATRANEIRSMLGLPARADSIKADSPIWLHRMSIDDALSIASANPAPGKGASSPVFP